MITPAWHCCCEVCIPQIASIHGAVAEGLGSRQRAHVWPAGGWLGFAAITAAEAACRAETGSCATHKVARHRDCSNGQHGQCSNHAQWDKA